MIPSSVTRSIRISGQSVMVAIRATTGRFSLSTTARALIDLNVSGASCIANTSRFGQGIERCHRANDRRWRHVRGTARSAFQIIFNFEPRSDLLDHFATIGVVYGSFLRDGHLPTVAIRLSRNHYVGRPVADVLHFHLDRGFEFGGCFARLFHYAYLVVVRTHWFRSWAQKSQDE